MLLRLLADQILLAVNSSGLRSTLLLALPFGGDIGLVSWFPRHFVIVTLGCRHFVTLFILALNCRAASLIVESSATDFSLSLDYIKRLRITATHAGT